MYNDLMARLLPDDPRHGSANAYTNYACRCDECRAGYSEYQVPRIQAKRRTGLPPGHELHGTDNGYTNFGCRCAMCCAARANVRSKKPAQAA